MDTLPIEFRVRFASETFSPPQMPQGGPFDHMGWRDPMKGRAALLARLKTDGLVLDHEEPDGTMVYTQGAKARGERAPKDPAVERIRAVLKVMGAVSSYGDAYNPARLPNSYRVTNGHVLVDLTVGADLAGILPDAPDPFYGLTGESVERVLSPRKGEKKVILPLAGLREALKATKSHARERGETRAVSVVYAPAGVSLSVECLGEETTAPITGSIATSTGRVGLNHTYLGWLADLAGAFKVADLVLCVTDAESRVRVPELVSGPMRVRAAVMPVRL